MTHAPHCLRLATCALALRATTAIAGDFDDWPTRFTLPQGTEISASVNHQSDLNRFSGGGEATSALADARNDRRREVGIALKKPGVYDVIAARELQSKKWATVAFRVESSALFGTDYGKWRVGYLKTPVGMEALAQVRAANLMEASAATQAVFEGLRTGLEWTVERDHYLLTAAWFFGHDLEGDNPGTTPALRAVWTPWKDADRVVHLGLSGSIENPRGSRDGRGVWHAPAARFRARPEAGLTTVTLVDSGRLDDVDRTVRNGAETFVKQGPLWLQAEYLRASAQRTNGQPGFTAAGYYLTGSWILTGETKPYAGGVIGNVQPKRRFGAVELLARYGDLDLDDAGIAGGRQRDWTLGANWYLTTHFKFQANYVRVTADRATVSADPRVFELRAQLQF